MCPYYLDGDHSEKLDFPGKRDKRSPDTRYIGYCAVFKVRKEACAPRDSPGHCLEPPAVSRSLKTQQHAGASPGAH
jgi:hypothetical protein